MQFFLFWQKKYKIERNSRSLVTRGLRILVTYEKYCVIYRRRGTPSETNLKTLESPWVFSRRDSANLSARIGRKGGIPFNTRSERYVQVCRYVVETAYACR